MIRGAYNVLHRSIGYEKGGQRQNVSGKFTTTYTRSTVLDWFVGAREFAEVVTSHLGLDFH